MSRLIDPDRLNSFLKKAVGALSVYIIFYDVFGGLINFILINANALFVNNLAGVIIILLLGAYFFVSAARLRTEKVMLFASTEGRRPFFVICLLSGYAPLLASFSM